MSVAIDDTRISELMRLARVESIPLNVLFELTHRCNLQCGHCYVVAEDRPELTAKEIEGVLEQLAAAGSLYLTFTGGEVLLREDFLDIVDLAHSLHFSTRVFTNGTLIDDAVADAFVAHGIRDVGVSVYGATASSHDRITEVGGSFDASVRALRMLRARGVRTALKCVLMQSNIAQHDAIVRFAHSLDAVPQFDFHVTPRVDGDPTPCLLEASEEEAALLPGLADSARMEFGELDSMLPCAAARDLVKISPSGVVDPCVQFPLALGDLRRTPFAEIWNSPAAEGLRAIRLNQVEECPNCSDLQYCRPCLGLNLIESGDLRTPAASSCRQARTRRRSVQL